MNGCLNKGSCIFYQEKETFGCSCKQPWRGERCELGKPMLCNFIHSKIVICFSLLYHLDMYTAMAVFLYRSLSGYMFCSRSSRSSCSSSSSSSSSSNSSSSRSSSNCCCTVIVSCHCS